MGKTLGGLVGISDGQQETFEGSMVGKFDGALLGEFEGEAPHDTTILKNRSCEPDRTCKNNPVLRNHHILNF